MGVQTDKPCDVSGVSNFAVAVEYTLLVVFPILRVDSDDKGTGYTAGSLTAACLSWDANRQDLRLFGVLEFCGGGGRIHSCCYTLHPPSTGKVYHNRTGYEKKKGVTTGTGFEPAPPSLPKG
jgi:hypothetical protein